MTVLKGQPTWQEDTADSAGRCSRVAAYIRAAVVMGRTVADPDAYLTLAIRRDAIQRWADSNGVRVERKHEDEGKTGRELKGPWRRQVVENCPVRECGPRPLAPCGSPRTINKDEGNEPMGASRLVTADSRGRVTVGQADRPYLLHEEPDGTVVLEPAVVMSELERRFLENAALQASIEYARAHPAQRVGRRPSP